MRRNFLAWLLAISSTACLSSLLKPRNVEAYLLSTSQSESRLDDRIPEDSPETYTAIREAKDWKNPYLVIRRKGIALRCLAVSREDWQIISANELRKALVELPVKAWPYGRVIVVQEIGIRSGNGNHYIAANKAKVEEVFKALGVRANWWPSA
jgi:hypothetical protein